MSEETKSRLQNFEDLSEQRRLLIGYSKQIENSINKGIHDYKTEELKEINSYLEKALKLMSK